MPKMQSKNAHEHDHKRKALEKVSGMPKMRLQNGGKVMRMERKYIARRRASAVIIGALLLSLFTYATRDVCYVGESGNALGYGSCLGMIEKVVSNGN